MKTINLNKWNRAFIGCCAIILAIVAGYVSKKNKYMFITPTETPYNMDNYYIYDIDSSKLQIQHPQYRNGRLEIKIICKDSHFIEECSPIIIKMNLIGGKKKKFNEIQYDLEYRKNLIVIPEKELPTTGYILRIGYYIYKEIFNGNYDYHSTAYKITRDKDQYIIEKYLNDNPLKDGVRSIIRSITEIKEKRAAKVYVYGYDISPFFNGFRDDKNHLLDSDNVIIVLKNGSRYEGEVRNGFFEGKGTFQDSLLHKIYEDRTFIKGNILSDTEVDNRTYIKTIERPLLSEEYPEKGCYKTEDVYIDSIHVQRTDYLLGRNEMNKMVHRKHIIKFDKDGNIKAEDLTTIKVD